jgi:hypothetical protein
LVQGTEKFFERDLLGRDLGPGAGNRDEQDEQDPGGAPRAPLGLGFHGEEKLKGFSRALHSRGVARFTPGA